MAIKHKAIKASGDAGLASEWNDDHKIDGSVDMTQYSWINQVIENLAAPPAGPAVGQVYFDTTLGEFRVWNGLAWLTYAGVDYVDGKVSLVKGETSYWTCAGCQFHADYDSSYPRQWEYLHGNFFSYTNNTEAFGSVDGIPNGSVVTGAVVYGTFGGSWRLFRKTLSTGTKSEMASAAANTEDTTINNATIDHTTYCYYLEAEDIDIDEAVRGARIKFTYP